MLTKVKLKQKKTFSKKVLYDNTLLLKCFQMCISVEPWTLQKQMNCFIKLIICDHKLEFCIHFC